MPEIADVEAFLADYEATPLEVVGSVQSGATRQERQMAYATLCAIERGGKAPKDFESPTDGKGAPEPEHPLPETQPAEEAPKSKAKASA